MKLKEFRKGDFLTTSMAQNITKGYLRAPVFDVPLFPSDGKRYWDPIDPCGLTLGTYYSDCCKKADNVEVIGQLIFQSLCGDLKTKNAKFPEDAPEIIKKFAHRTYVPDSEESRLRGAG